MLGVDTVKTWQKQSTARVHRALVTIVLTVSVASGALAATPQVKDVLPRLNKQRERVRTLYHKTETTITDKNKRPTRKITLETWEHYEKKVRKFHTISKAVTVGDAGEKTVVSHTVSDGRTTWREVPRGDTLLVIKSAAGSSSNRLTDLMKADHTKIKGREKIGGEPCMVMESTTMHRGDESTNVYWVSEAYGLILKSRTVQRDGSVSVMSTVTIKVNEPLSGAVFSYEPPEDATVLDTDMLRKNED